MTIASTAAPNLERLRADTAATNRRFEAALAAGDAARAAHEVYTRDARVMPPGAMTVVGRDAAAQFWTDAVAQAGITGLALETVELQPLGDDAAYEVGRAVLTVTGGQQVVGKYVVLWREEDGEWRWHVDIWNLDP